MTEESSGPNGPEDSILGAAPEPKVRGQLRNKTRTDQSKLYTNTRPEAPRLWVSHTPMNILIEITLYTLAYMTIGTALLVLFIKSVSQELDPLVQLLILTFWPIIVVIIPFAACVEIAKKIAKWN